MAINVALDCVYQHHHPFPIYGEVVLTLNSITECCALLCNRVKTHCFLNYHYLGNKLQDKHEQRAQKPSFKSSGLGNLEYVAIYKAQ